MAKWLLKNERSALIAIFALGLLLRIASCFLIDRADKDAVEYIKTAEDWSRQGIVVAATRNPRMPPLYSGLMALGDRGGVDAFVAGYGISVLFGALLVFPVFFLARSFFGPTIALIAAFLCATHPYLARVSAEIFRDSLFLFFLISALALAVDAAKRFSWFRWFLAGVAAALAAMTRTEGSEIIFAGFLWVALGIVGAAFNKDRRAERALRLKGLLFLLCGFNALAFPAETWLRERGSSWTAVDTRFLDFARGFILASKEEVMKPETE